MTTDIIPEVEVDRRLLVLDDEPDIAEFACKVARRAGFEARAANDAETFYSLVETWSPTVILLDLRMPKIDGIDVLRQMKADEVGAAVILTSGAGRSVLLAAERAAKESGLHVVTSLPKPFTPAELRDLLELVPATESAPTRAFGRHAATPPITDVALASALAAGEVLPYYQPKIDCRSHEVVGFEALARWVRADGSMTTPDQFIPLAETSGLIDQLTDVVFEAAVTWLCSRFPHSDVSISVNISALNLGDPDLAHRLAELCERAALDPRRVILELTETSTLEDPTATLELLTKCRLVGFNVSIDDFGVGYSSMVQLARLPFSELKIDKSFVFDVMQTRESQAIVSATVSLAKALGLFVTAEGVEHAASLEFLTELGCDYAQGFLIARPMSAQAIDGWLNDRTQT